MGLGPQPMGPAVPMSHWPGPLARPMGPAHGPQIVIVFPCPWAWAYAWPMGPDPWAQLPHLPDVSWNYCLGSRVGVIILRAVLGEGGMPLKLTFLIRLRRI